MKEIYVIFTCDNWKSKNSMVFVGVASIRKSLNRVLKNMAKEEVIPPINIKNFNLDNDIDISELNGAITNAYIETTSLNEFNY